MSSRAPDVADVEIAQALGVTVETYLEVVRSFKANPTKEPELELDEHAPEPEGGLEAILMAIEDEPDARDSFEARRVPAVVL
ncbi:MAG: hypothetical protein Q8S33_36950 [Myxococcales bacterium]|nr:hypothetical protein [Myxococcales bacterium]